MLNGLLFVDGNVNGLWGVLQKSMGQILLVDILDPLAYLDNYRD